VKKEELKEKQDLDEEEMKEYEVKRQEKGKE
jgi:hypothetical protein